MIRLALELLSAGSGGGRLSVLIFHRVLARKDELHVDLPDVAQFNRILSWLRSWFNVLALDEAVSQWKAGTLPPRAAAITFDDGYADNLTQAVPVLRRHGMSACFFIATGYLDGGRMWNDTVAEAVRACPQGTLDLADLGLGVYELKDMHDRRRTVLELLPRIKHLPGLQRQSLADQIGQRVAIPLPSDLMLTTGQLKALRNAGMQIGAHTVSHPILTRLDPKAAQEELANSKQHLEDILKEPVDLFAYPNGVPDQDYSAVHANMALELGFTAAFTTSPGAVRSGSSAYELPRFTPWDHTPTRYGIRMARNLLVRETRAAPLAA